MMVDSEDEHRKRWETWAELRLGPGFRVLTWTRRPEYYQISLTRQDGKIRETVIYTSEEL
jgi:hypothetical protein